MATTDLGLVATCSFKREHNREKLYATMRRLDYYYLLSCILERLRKHKKAFKWFSLLSIITSCPTNWRLKTPASSKHPNWNFLQESEKFYLKAPNICFSVLSGHHKMLAGLTRGVIVSPWPNLRRREHDRISVCQSYSLAWTSSIYHKCNHIPILKMPACKNWFLGFLALALSLEVCKECVGAGDEIFSHGDHVGAEQNMMASHGHWSALVSTTR